MREGKCSPTLDVDRSSIATSLHDSTEKDGNVRDLAIFEYGIVLQTESHQHLVPPVVCITSHMPINLIFSRRYRPRGTLPRVATTNRRGTPSTHPQNIISFVGKWGYRVDIKRQLRACHSRACRYEYGCPSNGSRKRAMITC
jgi:hypothetical protein